MNNRSGTSLIAAALSLRAARTCQSPSPLNSRGVALAVGVEAALREREFDRLHRPAPEPKKGTPKLLGCYVDGVLRFQSRDHEAIREYAAEKMRPTTRKLSDGSYRVITADVWVAPVGSFVTED